MNSTEAVNRIIADLTDRRGIKNEWHNIDEDIQEEIKAKWAKIIDNVAFEEILPPIKVTDAVSHIINSLDAGNASEWHDKLNDVTWMVDGRADTIIISQYDADGNERKQVFQLVEQSS